MKSPALWLCSALAFAAPLLAQVSNSDLSGWWAADPRHGGESSRVLLQFVDKDGKQEARLSLMAIAAYDIPLGPVTLADDTVTLKESFPLTWNAATQTLSGKLPADAAPVYDIPVEFRRSAGVEIPPVRDWKAVAPAPELIWSVDTGAPVWAGLERDPRSGTLFVANDHGDVHAIGRDGKPRWKFSTGKPIRSQPALLGHDLYVASDSGYLHALNAKTGKPSWRARVDEGSEPRIPGGEQKTRWDRYGSSVAADARHLYFASRDKHVYALERASGKLAWRVGMDDIMTATPALHGADVIVADYAGKVRALSTRDGAVRWTYDARLGIPGDVVVAGDRVLVGSRSYDLIALDANTGQELWKHYYWFSWIESPAVVRGDVLYTGSSDATAMYALNLVDGSLRWKIMVPGYAWQRPALSDDLLVSGTLGRGAYPASRNGSLFALDPHTGDLRWMYLQAPSEEVVQARTQWGFAAAPVIADGIVYAADFNGRVFAFKANPGADTARQ